MNKFHHIIVAVFCYLIVGMPTQLWAQKKTKSAKGSKTNTAAEDRSNMVVNQLFFDALNRQIKNDVEGSIVAYKKVLEQDPRNDAAMFALAKIYADGQNNEQAIFYAEKAIGTDPNNIWYAALYAETLGEEGKYDAAVEVYKKIVAKNPNAFEYYFDWAFMLIKARKYEQAIGVYDQIEKLVGIGEDISIQKQKLYIQVGKLDKAIAEAQRLIDSDPTEPHYYEGLAELYEANDMYDKAMDVYEKLLSIDPNNPNAQLAMAQHHLKKGDTAAFLKSLNAIIARPEVPISEKTKILSGYIGMKDKSPELEKLFYTLVQTHPKDALSYILLGDYLYNVHNNKTEALAQFQKGAAIDGNHFEVWAQIMEIELDLQNFSDLTKDSQKAVELFPNEAVAHFYNGVAHNRMKKYDSAVKSLKKATMLSVKNENLLIQSYILLGDSYNELKDYAKSDESYEKALKVSPNDVTVLNNYAYFLSLRNERLSDAAAMAAKANQLAPNTASYIDTYAWVLYMQKNYQEARLWMEKAIAAEGNTPSSTIVEHYGDVLFQLGEVEKAVEQWKKAKALPDASEMLEKKIRDKRP